MKKNGNKAFGGSALIWAIMVLAVLSIVVITSVTVSMAYAAAAADSKNETQSYYTAESYAKTLVEKICEGGNDELVNELLARDCVLTQNSDFTDIVTAKLESTEYPDGEVGATYYLLTVTAKSSYGMAQSVSAILKRDSIPTASAAFGVVAQCFNSNENNTTIIDDADTKFFVGTETTVANNQIGLFTASNSGNIFLPNDFINADLSKYGMFSEATMLFTTRPMSFVGNSSTMLEQNSFAPDVKSYYIQAEATPQSYNIAFDSDFDTVGTGEYYFDVRSNGSDSKIQLDISNTKTTAEASDCYNLYFNLFNDKDLEVTVNLPTEDERANTINLYIYGESNATVILNQCSTINGAISCGRVEIGGTPPRNITVKYVEPNTSIFAINDGTIPFSEKFFFVKYTEAE